MTVEKVPPLLLFSLASLHFQPQDSQIGSLQSDLSSVRGQLSSVEEQLGATRRELAEHKGRASQLEREKVIAF